MLTQLMASLAAIALLTAIAWYMGFRERPPLNAAMAFAQAAANIPGFRGQDVLLSSDCRSALVVDSRSGIALVHGIGDGWIVRFLREDCISLQPDNMLEIVLDEPMMRRVTFLLDGPMPDWLGVNR